MVSQVGRFFQQASMGWVQKNQPVTHATFSLIWIEQFMGDSHHDPRGGFDWIGPHRWPPLHPGSTLMSYSKNITL